MELTRKEACFCFVGLLEMALTQSRRTPEYFPKATFREIEGMIIELGDISTISNSPGHETTAEVLVAMRKLVEVVTSKDFPPA